jgi:hypothetical protein
MGVVRRAVRTAAAFVLAAALLVGGGSAAWAQPGVDLEAVAEALRDNSYYVDSRSEYLTSDTDLDDLRRVLQESPSVVVVVLPDTEQPQPVLDALPELLGQPATFVVLAGDDLQAASTLAPPEQVQAAVDEAVADNAGRPDLATLTLVQAFAGELPPGAVPAGGPPPAPGEVVEGDTLADAQAPGPPAAGSPAAGTGQAGSDGTAPGGWTDPWVLGTGAAALLLSGWAWVRLRRAPAGDRARAADVTGNERHGSYRPDPTAEALVRAGSGR